MDRLRVMFVDDDFWAIRNYKDFFVDDQRFDCEFFDEPNKALNRLNEEEFDILVTDYYMPGLNGVELIKFVKENNRVKFTVLISGSIYKREFEIADKFIAKGRGLRDLVSVLKRYQS